MNTVIKPEAEARNVPLSHPVGWTYSNTSLDIEYRDDSANVGFSGRHASKALTWQFGAAVIVGLAMWAGLFRLIGLI